MRGDKFADRHRSAPGELLDRGRLFPLKDAVVVVVGGLAQMLEEEGKIKRVAARPL